MLDIKSKWVVFIENPKLGRQGATDPGMVDPSAYFSRSVGRTEIVEIHTINLIDKPTDDEFDNDNIIGEVTNDAQDPVDNQASDGVDNSKALIAESTVYVKDYNNFIDDESTVDETTHDKYTHDEAVNDDFDI
nr:hypothetical protein [Tanacetum cinerariifolium]